MTCLVWHHLLLTLNSVINAIVQSMLTNAFPDSTKDAKEKKFQVFFFSFFALRRGLFVDSFWRLAWIMFKKTDVLRTFVGCYVII